ncbi:MAG: NAD(+)/NADH kinase [Coriobacteriia bacterium]|nr:NAD(+)/NADH kinase [Coriobacteriia bacterium]
MRVLLVPNTRHPGAVAAAAELSTWLLGQGLEPVLAQSDAEESGLADFGVASTDFGDLALTVALGGDGTILKAVHLLGGAEIPMLGVKFGRLGFLSGASPEHMREAIETTLSGEARVERRATLRAEVIMDGRPVGSYLALNEIVVSRGPSGRVVAFDLTIDGHSILKARADGIVVATATGSTAYALSAGGPAVAPGFGGMVVVPVAPHTLRSRAIVTDVNDTVEITLPDPTRADACLVVDGDPTPCRQLLERVTVSRGSVDVLLVKLDGRHFYETLSSEFFGG